MASPLVLVIDDEPQLRRVVRNAVEPGMGAVLEAQTGREGIDMADCRVRPVSQLVASPPVPVLRSIHLRIRSQQRH
jgi:CheY-like chemotaxis protein